MLRERLLCSRAEVIDGPQLFKSLTVKVLDNQEAGYSEYTGKLMLPVLFLLVL